MQQGYPWQPNFPGMQVQQPAQPQVMDRMAQQVQQRQQPSHGDFFVLVNGVEDVKNTLLQPNQGVWFRFQNDPYIAFKFANEVGTAETKYFEIREVDAGAMSGGGRECHPQQYDLVPYIQGIEAKVDQLEAQLNEMKGVNENGKPTEQVSQQNGAKPAPRK